MLLVQADGKIPNLALMKLSAWHKSQGDTVGLRTSNPDKVYVSVIFEKNLSNARGTAKFYPDAEFEIGGPALSTQGVIRNLPDHVESMMPDYDLYGIDYSMGFTSRGCFRKCPFCKVHEIEGGFREHKRLEQFHHPDHKKLLLFDNNFFRSALWKEKLDYVLEKDLRVCFTQGIDVRIVTDEMARYLRKIRSMNMRFNAHKVYTAWDIMEGEEEVLRGLRRLIKAEIPATTIVVFMLIGFNTTHEQDLYRFNKLRELRVDPFAMVYDNRMDDPWIRHFSRYVNKWFYRSVPLEKYKGGVLVE